MPRNSITSLQAAPHGALGSIASSWQFVGVHENILLVLSLILLLLSTTDTGTFGFITRVCWIASFGALSFLNIGAGAAAYITSLAIYSPLRVEGWSTLLQRPDNYAVVILFAAMLFLSLSRRRPWPKFTIHVLAFLLYALVHTYLLAPTVIPALIRDLVIPLLACVLIASIEFRDREINALLNGLALVGGYGGLVAILEGLHAANLALPPWIGDPSLRPFDPWLTDNEGRSGGTLLLPAFNGLLLSLILMALLLRLRRGGSRLSILAIALCAGGAFFTYERAVWLALALALLWFPGWCISAKQRFLRRISLLSVAAIFAAFAGGIASERLQDSGTILYRFALWGAAIRLFVAHPIVGIGFFNFGTAMTGAQQGFGPQMLSFREVSDGAASHNTLLTVIVEFGFVGFVLYAVTFLKILRAALNNASRLWGKSGIAWIFAFTIVYFVNAQFISSFEGTTNAAFFALLGMMAGLQLKADCRCSGGVAAAKESFAWRDIGSPVRRNLEAV